LEQSLRLDLLEIGVLDCGLPKEAPMQRAIVLFKIPRRNNDRIHYPRSVATAMTGNPHFPSPTPTMAAFEAHIDAAADAKAHVLIGPIGSAAQRDAKFAAVQSDLEQLRLHVQHVADASSGEAHAIIESAGMSLRRPGLHDKQALTVKAVSVAGSVVVVAKAAGDRATYEWQYSRVGEPWIEVERTRQAKKAFEGLVPGATYRFRVRAVTRAGRSDFGEVVSFLC
jgi:hypothetical protein